MTMTTQADDERMLTRRGSGTTIVEAVGIERSFGDTRVLRGVDLQVSAGTVFALLGPNGAGKTTMVHILTTLLRPDAGTATIAGHDVVTEPDQVKRLISLTGQYAAVDEILTGHENMVMMGRLCHLGKARARARAAELLEQFDLGDAATRPVKTWSGGMRRRLDLAISLIAGPPVIFLDEPTTGLDPHARQTMWRVIERLVAGGTTIVLTTQYLDEADRLADRIAVLDHGRIIAEGTPAELKRRIPGERVELGFADDAAYEQAVRALAADGDRDTGPARCDAERRTVGIATDGSAEAVRRLLDLMDREHLAVADLSLHRPSLDDVFLLLTGSHPTTLAPEGIDR